MSIPLIRVQNDPEWHTVIRKGRFTAPRDCGHTPRELMSTAHGQTIVKEAQERMIEGLRVRGQILVDSGFSLTAEGGSTFKLEGPFPHLPFIEDASADPGSTTRPDVRDTVRWRDWERAERGRTAKRVDAAEQEQAQYHDWVLRAVFRKLHPTSFRKHVAYQHEIVASRLRQAALVGSKN